MISLKLFFICSYIPGKQVISIQEALCGNTIQLNADVHPAIGPEWLVNWQKNRTGAEEPINISCRKYCGSHSRQLVINCVSKKDEGRYQAFLSREFYGKTDQIFSNCIYLLPQKGTLFCCKELSMLKLKKRH